MKSCFLASSVILGLAVTLAGCHRRSVVAWQGYLEGEFVYVAGPLPGRRGARERRRLETGARSGPNGRAR